MGFTVVAEVRRVSRASCTRNRCCMVKQACCNQAAAAILLLQDLCCCFLTYAAQVQPDCFETSQCDADDYSLEGWGFDSPQTGAQSSSSLPLPLDAAIASANYVVQPDAAAAPRATSPLATADAAAAAAATAAVARTRSNSVLTPKDSPTQKRLLERLDSNLTFKDTPNFRKVRRTAACGT